MSDKTHAIFSPSGASRWGVCPGSAILAHRLNKESESSSYADEGTLAHAFLEHLLRGKPENEFVPETKLARYWSATMQQIIRDLAQRIQEGAKADNRTLTAEEKVSLLPITGEDHHGTVDITEDDADNGVLFIEDLKYGAGKLVCADHNPQLALYAAAQLAAKDPFGCVYGEIVMCIHQPRIDGGGSEWRVPVPFLNDFVMPYAAIARAGLQLLDPAIALPETLNTAAGFSLPMFSPSADICRWCAVKTECPALRREAETAFDDLNVVKSFGRKVDAATLAKQIETAQLLLPLCKAVIKEGRTRILAGEDIPGWAVRKMRSGQLVWAEDQVEVATTKAGTYLKKDQYIEEVLKTPDEIRRALLEAGKEKYWDRTVKPLTVQQEDVMALMKGPRVDRVDITQFEE